MSLVAYEIDFFVQWVTSGEETVLAGDVLDE